MSVFERNDGKKALELIENRLKYATSYYGDAAREHVPKLQACRGAIRESLRLEPKPGDFMTKEGELAIIEYAAKDGTQGFALGVFDGAAWAFPGHEDADVLRWGRVPAWVRDASRRSRRENEEQKNDESE